MVQMQLIILVNINLPALWKPEVWFIIIISGQWIGAIAFIEELKGLNHSNPLNFSRFYIIRGGLNNDI